MPYPIKHTNFFFRVGEDPAESMRIMLAKLGVRVIQISTFPLALSGGSRMEIYLDTQGKDTNDLQFSLDAHRGFIDIPTTVYIGDPQDVPPPPPVKNWWELLQEPVPGAPRVKIYAVENHLTHSTTVPVYKSDTRDREPTFTDIDTRTKQRGESAEVWHSVTPGSKWVCVFDGNMAGKPLLVLWMWADDLSPTPV